MSLEVNVVVDSKVERQRILDSGDLYRVTVNGENVSVTARSASTIVEIESPVGTKVVSAGVQGASWGAR